MTKTISGKLITFTDVHREKRGLFDGVGKIEKWLFGTLDSEDEEHINSYMQSLQTNQNKIAGSLEKQSTLLKTISKSYSNNFQKLVNFIQLKF